MYKIIDKKDNSNAVKKISVSIIIDDSENLNELIPVLNEKFKKVDADNPKQHSIGKLNEVVYMYFYTNELQLNYGLPCCRTQWISDTCRVKPAKISSERITDVYVSFDEGYKSLEPIIREAEMDKESYVKYFNNSYEQTLSITLDLRDIYDAFDQEKISFDKLNDKMLSYKIELNKLQDFEGFPPSDDEQSVLANHHLRNAISSLHDIPMILENQKYEEKNKKILIYLKLVDATKGLFSCPEKL
ncbi:hypothetical protein ABES80_00960 [Bacillus gobiensis]|uniref:hypothetical protein n=1 Tax=Bacillus gobiensis TaxID=1441095 RepID=UPI003D1ED35E